MFKNGGYVYHTCSLLNFFPLLLLGVWGGDLGTSWEMSAEFLGFTYCGMLSELSIPLGAGGHVRHCA